MASAAPTRDAWIDEGLRLLREDGHEAIRIDAMCKALGLTRGSFYHHFEDRDAFVDAMLARWQADQEEALRVAKDALPRGKQGFPAVIAFVAAMDHDLELSLRTWSHKDARVRAVTSRIDQARLGYFETVARAIAPPDTDARFLAELSYSSLIGAQQLGIVNRTPAGVRDWNKRFLRAIHVDVTL